MTGESWVGTMISSYALLDLLEHLILWASACPRHLLSAITAASASAPFTPITCKSLAFKRAFKRLIYTILHPTRMKIHTILGAINGSPRECHKICAPQRQSSLPQSISPSLDALTLSPCFDMLVSGCLTLAGTQIWDSDRLRLRHSVESSQAPGYSLKEGPIQCLTESSGWINLALGAYQAHGGFASEWCDDLSDALRCRYLGLALLVRLPCGLMLLVYFLQLRFKPPGLWVPSLFSQAKVVICSAC